MKNLYKACAFVLAFQSAIALGGAPSKGPLLVKKSVSGFVPAEWRKQETCSVYSDRVVIERIFGQKPQTTSVETRAHHISGSLEATIQAAAKGQFNEESALVIDVPTYEYYAYGASGKAIVLRNENGASGQITFNSSPASFLLMNVIEGLCPKVFE